MRARMRIIAATASVFAVTVAALGAAQPAPAAPSPLPITVWTDAVHAAAISSLVADGYRGHQVVVVTKDLTAIRDELATVPAAAAPDVIWADSTWTEQLAASGSVLTLAVPKRVVGSFRSSALDSFAVGADRYGMPVQVSNVALISNAALVPQAPSNFGELQATALKLQSKGKVKIAFAVGQGGDSDGYPLYPLFAGLGGYFFGRDPAGAFDPSQVGIANKTFLGNASQIDDWNKAGFLNSALSSDQARRAFSRQRAPFWIAGPEEMATLLSLKFNYRITSVPTVVPGLKSSPLLRVQGFMVTKHAEAHGVRAVASRFVRSFMAQVGSQLTIAAAAGLIPANRDAVARASARLQAFDLAGIDGVPLPNIPQLVQVWAPYGGAWAASTAGATATAAKSAFRSAQRAVRDAIG